MHRWNGAAHRQPGLDLRQGQVWLGGDQFFESLAIDRQYLRLPTRKTMPVAEVLCFAPLLEQLLHHAERHPKAPCYLLPRPLLFIIRPHDPLPQIQRQCFHPVTVHKLKLMATV